jgi:hypothetical protein
MASFWKFTVCQWKQGKEKKKINEPKKCNKETIKINETRKNQRYKTREEGNSALNTSHCVCVSAGITQQTNQQTNKLSQSAIKHIVVSNDPCFLVHGAMHVAASKYPTGSQ